MKLRLLFLLLLFSLSSFKTNHTFYVSVTEIEYNEKAQSLQIISRVFSDDLENLLQKRYDESLRLSEKKNSEKLTGYLNKYLGQRLQVQIDGKPQKLNYLGMEHENDMVLLYLEIPGVPQFKNIRIKNSVLTDLFSDQKNLVHVDYKGEIKSLILTHSKDENLLIFSN